MPALPDTDSAHRPAGCIDACPACRHRDWPASRSLAQKQDYLARELAPWRDRLQPLQPAPQRLAYRDKTTLHCQWDGARWQVGLRRRERLVPVPRCPVHSDRVNACLALLRERWPPPAAGFRLHYYVQAGAQLTLVLKQAVAPPPDWFDDRLAAALTAAGLEGLWLQLYPAAGYHKFSKRGWRLLWGWPRSRGADGAWHGPESFQQALPALHAQALDEAAGFLDPGAGDPVIDFCCGTGASLGRWLEAGARVLAVELNGEALECAARNALGAELLRGRCAQRLPQVERWLGGRRGRALVFANPPRTGLEAPVLDWLAAGPGPRRLAYLACSAGSLGRDLAHLAAAGFRVRSLQGYDFFPLTHHVETLALLERTRDDPPQRLPDRGADSVGRSP